MIEPSYNLLRDTRRGLTDVVGELTAIREDVVRAPMFDLGRTTMALDTARELRSNFSQQLSDLRVELEDGRHLLRPQLASLAMFAANNDISLKSVLNRATIENEVIVSCQLAGCGLHTLKGLEELWSLRSLAIYNFGGAVTPNKITSLSGIPTDSLEEIRAEECGLKENLVGIAEATKLRKLDVRNNKDLHSLKGVPTQSIEEICAYGCDLTGGLSEIRAATGLRWLDVRNNRGLTSLRAVPLQSIESIFAAYCGLSEDHTFLSAAPNLSWLALQGNPLTLTLDRKQFGYQVHIIL